MSLFFQNIESTIAQIPLKSLLKRMLLGAIIGLILISSLLYSVKNPNPDWGTLWFIRPLITVPLAGALGSLFFYLKDFIASQSIWKRILVMPISLIAFIVALWVGIVLGLDGTLWN
jgi:uncharacterized protein YacL